MNKSYIKLVDAALGIRNFSYSPYSKFKVGAALLAENDKIYTGINIENASFAVTLCAERAAFAKAVSEGQKKFKAIAIAANKAIYPYPCGLCRQFMSEFSKDMTVILIKDKKNIKIITLSEIFPNSFDF